MSETKPLTLSSIVDLKDSDFDEAMNLTKRDAKEKTIVLFYSPMCHHCVRMKGDYIELAEQAIQGKLGNDVTVAAVNSMDNQDLMRRIHSPDMIEQREFLVNGVPTIVSFYKGQYYSTYGPSETEEGRKKFRTLEDLIEYTNGIGNSPITYINRGQ